jgi:hypothetical protein
VPLYCLCLLKWTGEGVFFVTRMKDNAIFTVIESHPVSPDSSVKKDDIVLFAAPGAAERCPYPVRDTLPKGAGLWWTWIWRSSSTVFITIFRWRNSRRR